MARKILLTISGATKECAEPPAGSPHVDTMGSCPSCASPDLRVQGRNAHPSTDDRALEADAVALCCGTLVGQLRVEMNTLFGVREDRAMLESRARVY